MASIGAFVAADASVINYLRYNLRSQIFAKALPMAIVEGNIKRLELLKNSPELREKLWANVNLLQSKLKENGFDIGCTDSPVTPVYMHGGVIEASHLIVDLRENYNIFCSIVVYPVIPKGHILLRLIPTSVHTEEDINETIEAFITVKHKLESKLYPEEFPIVV